MNLYSTVWVNFQKFLIQPTRVSQIPLPKPKFEIGFTKAKDEMFSHCYKDIAEHLNRQIRLSFRFEKNNTCVLSIKKFEHYGDHFILTDVVNLGYREIKHLQESIICCSQMWHFWEQLQCVAHSSRIVGMTIALLFLLETCIAQIQSVWVNFARTKRLFNLLAEAIINVRNMGLCARCAIFFLKNKQTPFSCHLVKEFTFLKRDQSQFKKLLELCIVLESFVSTEKCESIGGYVTTPRCIYGCGKCGAWLFCSQSSFYVTRACKHDKNRQNTLFICQEKRWTCYPTNNYYLLPQFKHP